MILYRMLTGERPFVGDRSVVFEAILNQEPKPLRQIDASIPRELELICLKCLAKWMTDRYATVAEFAEDLKAWLTHQGSPAGTGETASWNTSQGGLREESGVAIKVVPKGLRSFDARDADFFLELLPGPRDRHGLPESLRFWKMRVEETDPVATFSVGLLYGPSGCGKTSLVKAGLLPRLADHVLPVHIEATPDGTATRLIANLGRHCPAVAGAAGLPEMLAALREGAGPAGKKVFLVIDQFEQWLHGGECAG